MAVLTFNTFGRQGTEDSSRPKSRPKVVSIDDYRGTVILPPRQSPASTPASRHFSSDPLTAA